MRIKIAYGFALCCVVLCVSCGGLSRSTATDILRKHFERDKPTEARVLFRLFGSQTQDDLAADNQLGPLYRLGYVACETVPAQDITTDSGEVLRHIPERCRVVLTPKGVEAAKGWELYQRPGEGVSGASIPVARPEVIEITGLSEDGTEATATYTWRQKPLNEIGEALGYGQQTETGSALALLTSSGKWLERRRSYKR